MVTLLDLLTRHWWLLVVRGAFGILFGILALVWPGATIAALVLLFGAYAIIDGVATLYAAITGRESADRGLGRARASGGHRVWLAVEGLLGIGAGLIAFFWPGITALVLLWVIAFWAVLTGAMELATAIRLRRELSNEWLLGLAGAASILFGLLLIIRPGTGALAVIWLIGTYALIFGVIMIVLGFRLRGAGQHPATA
jgi:uncharacterized membrane protein HdeD (DUF308 family)